MTDSEQKRILSKNLQYYVEKSGRQQKEICKALGINQTTFSMWYTGNSLPRMDKLQKLSDYFGVPKSMLLDEHKFGEPKGLLIEKISTMDDAQLNRLLSYCNFMLEYEDKEK